MSDRLSLECLFADKSVTYEQFIEELATRLAEKITLANNGELEVSQNKAYKMFGRCDVDRWIKSGKLKPSRISPGKIRYRLVDLLKLSEVKQNRNIAVQSTTEE